MPNFQDYILAVAEECGPLEGPYVVDSGSVSSSVMSELVSAVKGEHFYDDQFIWHPASINTDNEVRTVATYDPVTGEIAPDRVWGSNPSGDELYLMGMFDPRTIRDAVNEALKHCYYNYQKSFAATGNTTRRYDLTATGRLPWLTSKDQVRGLFHQATTLSLDDYRPVPLYGDVYQEGSKIYLDIMPLPTTETLYIRSVTPAYYLCTSLVGVAQDGLNLYTDLAPAPIDWVVPRALIELWRKYSKVLEPKAAERLVKDRKEVSDWFAQATATYFKPEPRMAHEIHHWGPTWRY